MEANDISMALLRSSSSSYSGPHSSTSIGTGGGEVWGECTLSVSGSVGVVRLRSLGTVRLSSLGTVRLSCSGLGGVTGAVRMGERRPMGSPLGVGE